MQTIEVIKKAKMIAQKYFEVKSIKLSNSVEFNKKNEQRISLIMFYKDVRNGEESNLSADVFSEFDSITLDNLMYEFQREVIRRFQRPSKRDFDESFEIFVKEPATSNQQPVTSHE